MTTRNIGQRIAVIGRLGQSSRPACSTRWLSTLLLVLVTGSATAQAQARVRESGRAADVAAARPTGKPSGMPIVRGIAPHENPAGAALGELRGRVVDAGAERPLPAASVLIEGNGEAHSATSSLDGGFAFRGLSPGNYTLVVVRSSYRPSRLGVVVPEGAALVLDVQLTRIPVALQRVVVQAMPDSAADVSRVEGGIGALVTDSRRAPRPVDLLSSQGQKTIQFNTSGHI